MRRNTAARWWSVIAVTVSILMLCVHAWGRAGGGGHFSGGGGGGGGGGFGGGGGGGGGSGGGDLFYIIYLWVRFCIAYPYIGLPVSAGGVWLIYYIGRQGRNGYRTSVIRRGSGVMDQMQKAAALAKVQEQDPNFDEQKFLERLSVAFMKIQEAWCAQDLHTVRPFISDGIYERFTLQIDEQKFLGLRDKMENIRILNMSLAAMESHNQFDEISVQIHASAVDYEVSLKDGDKVGGSTAAAEFVEVWSFLRHRGAQTRIDRAGLIEGNCPNCGAAIEMNQSANCTHCKALLRSGQYDWVLSEITQDSEWEGIRPDQVPGVQPIRQADPEFNLQALEDRASVMFWRLRTSERQANVQAVRKMASEPFCRQYEAQLKSQTEHWWFGECGVGKVQTLALQDDGQWQRAVVVVRWSGTRFSTDLEGRPHNTGQGVLSRTGLILGRRSDCKSDANLSISSAHCPNCGAPETGGDSSACNFCGTVLNDGMHGWILLDVGGLADEKIQQLINNAPAAAPAAETSAPASGNGTPEGTGVLVWMIKMMLADGRANEQELWMLETAARRRNVPDDRLKILFSAAQSGEIDVPEPRDPAEAREWLSAMADEALADGKIQPREQALLHAVGSRYGMTAYDVKLLVTRQQNRRYDAARDALRQSRSQNKS